MKEWNFPSVKNIGIKGFNDIGEEFKDNPMQSLAKEICQNSLDTKLTKNYKLDNPIRISFNEFFIAKENFPGYNDFLEIIKGEKEYNSNFYNYDKTVPNFYQNAFNELNKERIRCLRISDFNTTGLLGSDKESQSAWCDLTKNAGVSDKPEGSGGSKGKGKYASFICSNFYTVFYSTYAMDNLQASCGIARLSGYQLPDKSITIGEGYYENNDRFLKKDVCMNLDPNFKRKEFGTDLYILGFRDDYENWRDQIVASVLDNFFASIIRGELELFVDDKFILTKNTIKEVITDVNIKKYLGKETEKYYEIMTSLETDIICEKYSMFEPDDLILKIKVDKNHSNNEQVNTVAAIRSTGMKILDLKNLPKLGFYNGVLEMNGVKVNEYFRNLENASHNRWSASRARDKGNSVSEAQNRINELKKFIRDSIKKNLTERLIEEIDAEGVSEFLPDEDEFTENTKGEESIEDIRIKNIDYDLIIPKDNKSDKIDGDDFEDVELDENGNLKLNKPHTGESHIDNPTNSSQFAKYSEVKRMLLPKKVRVIEQETYYKILFATNEDEKIIKIRLCIYGENNNEKVNITKLKVKKINKFLNYNVDYEYFENYIILKNVKKEEEYSIDVQIDTDELWRLEVNVYGCSEE